MQVTFQFDTVQWIRSVPLFSGQSYSCGDSAEAFSSNGDTGLSSGIKQSVQTIHGQKRLIPIYDAVAGHGGGVEFHVVGWASVRVIDSSWNGSKNTHVQIKKAFMYGGYLTPPSDLSDNTGTIEGAFASSVLVQ